VTARAGHIAPGARRDTSSATSFSTVYKRLQRLSDLEEIDFTGAGQFRLLPDAQPHSAVLISLT